MSPVGALIQICALESVADPSRGTAALEAAGRVGAGGLTVAVMGSDLTFIYISAAGGALADGVAHFTVADEGAFGVFAVSAQTDVRVQLALVHIHTGLHVLRRHESIEAETLVSSWSVGALASITDVWTLLALINVSAGAEVRHQGVSAATTALVAPLRVCAK